MSKLKIKVDLTKPKLKKPKGFERWSSYKSEQERIANEIKNKSNVDKILYLQDQYKIADSKIDNIIETSDDIKSILNNPQRREIEVTIDIIRQYLEDILNKDEELVFKYPELFDNDFARKIYEKKEFYINKMPIGMVIKESTNKPRQRTSIQKFVKNYISEYTPYNGILLWHGVGVGKTCAGISIAENFRDYVQASNQKLLVLTPSDTLVQTWKDEIFNIEREEMKRKAGQIVNVQCTGDRYLSELKKFNSENLEISRREVNRLINKYYEIIGYQKLANQVNKELLLFLKNKKYQQREVIEYFKLKFSNRVIIMDEVHFTREEGSANDKVARPFLEMIARYAENVKIVLLSATPMYNISSEITWILNLLLWNDKRAPLEPEMLFDKNGIGLKEYPDDMSEYGMKYGRVIDIIRSRSRGYISYLRSENPITFPLKLEPNKDYRYIPNPSYQLIGGKKVELEDKDKIKHIKFFCRDSMSEWQYNNVLKFMNLLPDSEKEIDIDDLPEESSGFSSKPTQASNIVFPLLDGGEVGEEGFNSCLIPNAQKKLEYASHVRNIGGKPFLHIDNIGEYSAKFKNIINLINTSTGIIFIYSQFVKGGVKALACALEANGFCRYVGDGKVDNLLADNKEKNPRKRYILLDGSVPKNQLNKLVKECRGTTENPNTNGEFIKVILGTKVIETGISFLRVREIHILDPWHHLNTMEQAAGRGIRNFSHIQLPLSERNVTLYLHIGALPEDNDSELETNDERIYRRAYVKKKNMAVIERQLKISAVDCGLNRMGNIFVEPFYKDIPDNPLKERRIISSQTKPGDEPVYKDLYDIDGSMICDFQECDYKCEPDISSVTKEDINSKTFNEFYAEDEIELVKELIKNMFTEEYVFSDKEIFEILRDMKVELEDHYIYLALNDLVENKNEVLDGYYRPGYIINRINPKTKENFYIFQPKEIEDIDIPMMNRYLKEKKYNKFINIDKLPYEKVLPRIGITKKLEKPIEQKTIEINNDIGKNLKDFLIKLLNIASIRISLIKGYNDTSNKLKPSIEQLKQYYIEHILDRLSETDKVELFKLVIPLINKNGLGLSSEEKIVLETILNYYDKRNEYDESYLFLRSKRDLLDKAEQTIGNPTLNEIVGFRVIYRDLFEKDGKYFEGETKIDYYIKKDESFQKLSKIASDELHDKLKIPPKYNTFKHKKDELYGYPVLTKGKIDSETLKSYKLFSTEFYIVNTMSGTAGEYIEKKDKLNRISKKSERRGARCGTAIGANNLPQLKQVINVLLEEEKYSTDSERSSYPSISNIILEIELLLRHREHQINNKNDRFFYKIEDTLLPNCNVADKNKRICGAVGISKEACSAKSCCYELPPDPNPLGVPTCFYPSER